jgi:molybdopterin-guanine dinucleotide biosynthesis protein A
MTFDDFTGYVLAGGKSSRMRTDKAFLEIEGETFLHRAVKALETAGANPLKIVLNKAQTNFIERLPDRVPHIFDIYENSGALSGIHAALSDCRSEWIIILAVDLPFVSSEAIENLARIAYSSKDFAAIVPVQTDGRPQPLCAVYRAEDCLPKLEDLLSKNTSAPVRDFLELVPTHFIGQDELVTNTSEDLFYNVNRPSDFQTLVLYNQSE